MCYDASFCSSILWACLMKKILLIALLCFGRFAFADFVVMGEPSTASSSADGACSAWGALKKLDAKLSSSSSGASDMPNYTCTVSGVIGGYPVSNKAKVIYDGCSSGTVLNGDKNACITEDNETCEILKGKVVYSTRASYCMSSGQPRYYINKCDVLASDGAVIIAPPDDNSSMGYLGDWVVTGKPRSACIPDPDPNEEDNKGEEGEDKGEQGGDNGGETGGNEGGDDGGNTGGGTGGGNNSGGSSGGSGGGGGGGTGSPGTETGGGNGNGDGDGGGTGSEGGGTGGGGTGGSGNGDGDGEEDKPSAGGLPCNQALICKGDAVQCAQLEKQKQIQCAQEDLYRMDSEIKTDLQQQVNKNTQKIDGFGDNNSPTVNIGDMITKGSGWLPRSCPPPAHFNVYGKTFDLSYEYTCNLATDLSGLIVALFSFLGIRVFARQG